MSLYNEEMGEIVIGIMDVKTILLFKNTKVKVGAIIGVLTFAAISSPFLIGYSWLEPYERSASDQLYGMAMSLFFDWRRANWIPDWSVFGGF